MLLAEEGDDENLVVLTDGAPMFIGIVLSCRVLSYFVVVAGFDSERFPVQHAVYHGVVNALL